MISSKSNMNKNNKKVLYVAFHYPPIQGSSGVHRTLAFTRHLSENHWDINVLTCALKGYDYWEESHKSFIPDNVNVIRAYGRNCERSLSIKGRYLSMMALPDNWQSWIFGGVFSGLIAIFKHRPNVLVSTYPLASAQVIAYILHKLTGVPWVADLRDPMAQDDYPKCPKKRRIFSWLERKMVKHCKKIIVTTPTAKAFYQKRFKQTTSDLWHVVPNGYDEAMFKNAEAIDIPPASKKKVLLHSGVIYPIERDPRPLFEAISNLKKAGVLNATNFELRLRAAGHDEFYHSVLQKLDVTDLVNLVEAVPFQKAVEEMYQVDGLLLLQAANCDAQIPAKAYEYIKVGRPILALTSREGDTGKLMAGIPNARIAPLDSQEHIEHTLAEFLKEVAEDKLKPLSEKERFGYSRQYHANTFEECLKQAIS